MDSLTLILLVIIAVLTALSLVVVFIIYSNNKRRENNEEKTTALLAELISAKVLEELKSQRMDTIAEAREQRLETLEMATEQRRELSEILGKSNLQTTQLIQASSDMMQKNLSEMQKGVAEMQNAIRDKVDERLDAIQRSNEQKLEEMRKTVDEKLESTLNTRLKNSFDMVSQQLESVNTRLGEMRSVADSVSNLNKTLSGSKTRGILGELQLAQIIEDMLPTQLYEREAQMREGSGDRVEYAIKLPGQEEEGFVYLPIDSKFPLDDYYRLIDGLEKGDTSAAAEARKALLARIKDFANSVRKKYINPPYTTSFAVLFLPTEGLYAEAVRDAVFFEDLRKQGIMLAGPTTMAAMLSSLQIGFKTLQIQKGAVEIQNTLEKTKKEFSTFGDVLVKAQSRIRQTGDELDKLVGARTKKINAALKNVQTYTFKESNELDNDEVFPELEAYYDDESEGADDV